ncbi:MAG: cytidine deaminase [Succinivibrio sp.]|nr:cytidine deaminase [Succinivibrio sp.]
MTAQNSYQRPTKDESFLQVAQAVSMRSTCLRRRYGAVIVSRDGRIISTGYNGAPRHRANCIELGVCLRQQLQIKPGTHYELCRSVHAEANAIINGDPLEIVGGTLYLVGTEAADNQPTSQIGPCAMCQRLILNAQIARVVMRTPDGQIVSIDPTKWEDDLPENIKQKLGIPD